MSPAKVKRVQPIDMGGQKPTMNFVPALLAPQRKMARSSPEEIALLLGLLFKAGEIASCFLNWPGCSRSFLPLHPSAAACDEAFHFLE